MAAPVGRISSKMPHDDWVRCFDVSESKKHEKGYTVYKVTYKIYSRQTAELTDEIVIWKRYNDFKKLHKILSDWHRKLQRREEFPLFARAKVFGRFEEAVIEERRHSAFDLLAFVSCQYHLYNHKAFKAFFEGGQHVNSDADIERIAALKPEKNWTDVSRDSMATADVSLSGESTERDRMGDQPGTGEGVLGGVWQSGNEEGGLGGVWQYRQANDNLSLESTGTDAGPENDDDDASFTDDSALTTPLPDDDLTFFDPLHETSADLTNLADDRDTNNTWLLSAMSICADLDSNSARPSPVHRSNNESESATGGMKLSTTMEEIANRHRSGTGESVSKMDIGGSDDYIYQAARQISMARDSEANGQYNMAFDYYKTGVGILLTGVQDDSNKARREAVRKKTAQYLLKAEDLYNKFLRTVDDSQQWTAEIRVSLYRNIDPAAAFLQGSVTELANYRVLGVIDRVMLVLDKNTENTYIMKTLRKCSDGTAQIKNTIIPQNVPYMVRLYRLYDTDSAIYLLLQHATGGKLWNYISAYLNHYNDERSGAGAAYGAGAAGAGCGSPRQVPGNIYAGQKFLPYETQLIEKAEMKIIETEAKKGIDYEQCAEYRVMVDALRRDLPSDMTSPTLSNSGRSNVCYGDVQPWRPDGGESGVTIETEKGDRHGDENTNKEILSDKDFQSTLNEHKTAKPALAKFSIASMDSSDDEPPATSIITSISDRVVLESDSNLINRPDLADIPENDAISENITDVDADGESMLPSTDELVNNARKLLTSVSLTLNEKENELSHETPDVVRSAILPRRFSAPSDDVFRTSSILGVEIATKRMKDSDGDNGSHGSNGNHGSGGGNSDSDNEQCIYDLNAPKSQTNSPEKKVIKTSQKSPSPTRTNKYCPPVQRPRNFSNVFREFDDMLNKENADVKMPEVCVKQWAAEIFLALDGLHRYGIICRDLNPMNILLGDRGHVLLSYMSEWTNVHQSVSQQALTYNYCAPEVGLFYNVQSFSCDWWSFGAILYELLTCKSLHSCHTSGINSHTQLIIPDHVSSEAQDLLRKLLRYNPNERLGSGIGGADDIRHHPFFQGVDWTTLQTSGS